MYAYIDETGNTGSNIFDETQPYFITASLITKYNFDILQRKYIQKLARTVGETELHGNEYGLGKTEEIASGLLSIFKTSNARFFIARAEKRYIAVVKLFDTLFDSFENKAVPWHIYNIKYFRLLLVFKLTTILRQDVVEIFWKAILEKNKIKSYELFRESLLILKSDLDDFRDKRARELTENAVDWALANPESIYIHTAAKSARAGHLPNMAIFPDMLQRIEMMSQKWKRPVKTITHDQQSQFQKVLKGWHEMFSNAATGVIEIPFEPPRRVRCVAGSTFIIKSSSESPGIQAIDIVLWLFKKFLDGETIPYNSATLLNHVFKFGYQNDLSFDGVGKRLDEEMLEIYSKPFGETEQEKAIRLLEFAEKRRQESMEEYFKNKEKL